MRPGVLAGRVVVGALRADARPSVGATDRPSSVVVALATGPVGWSGTVVGVGRLAVATGFAGVVRAASQLGRSGTAEVPGGFWLEMASGPTLTSRNTCR